MDIFEKFIQREQDDGKRKRKELTDSDVVSETEIDDPEYGTVKEFRGRRGFAAGTVVNKVMVVGRHFVQGRYGKLSHRKYVVQCVAPTGPEGAECGKKGIVNYHQLYYGSVYSCGCVARPKHPPIRLEGQTFGRIEVLRWTAEYGGAWEILCHECGELLYRKSAPQARAAGNSCTGHSKVYC